jgi:hypothetical protein
MKESRESSEKRDDGYVRDEHRPCQCADGQHDWNHEREIHQGMANFRFGRVSSHRDDSVTEQPHVDNPRCLERTEQKDPTAIRHQVI